MKQAKGKGRREKSAAAPAMYIYSLVTIGNDEEKLVKNWNGDHEEGEGGLMCLNEAFPTGYGKIWGSDSEYDR